MKFLFLIFINVRNIGSILFSLTLISKALAIISFDGVDSEEGIQFGLYLMAFFNMSFNLPIFKLGEI